MNVHTDVWHRGIKQHSHLLLRQPYRFFGELYIQPNRVIRALVYNNRFVCLAICLHLFCHLLSFSPSSVSGTTIIYCLYFYSFSIHFRNHLATILNVSVGFLSLFYLFPFYLPCSFFYLFLFGPSLSKFACLFCASLSIFYTSLCLFLCTLCLFYSNFASKKTQPLFSCPTFVGTVVL